LIFLLLFLGVFGEERKLLFFRNYCILLWLQLFVVEFLVVVRLRATVVPNVVAPYVENAVMVAQNAALLWEICVVIQTSK
jgi:hypothetical protein